MARRAAARAWLALELELLLDGAEERRVSTLHAWRDRLHPLIWDRHLAVATGAPVAGVQVERDLDALDAYYREGGSSRWALVGAAGDPATRAWAEVLLAEGGAEEPLVTLAKTLALPPVGCAPAEGVAVLSGAPGIERLAAHRLAETTGEPSAAAAGQVLELLAVRARRHEVVVLAAARGGATVASIVLTVCGERAWLEDLETSEAWRGRGLGGQLLALAEDEAAQRGARVAGLQARADDWPWHWYERCGWRVAGEVTRVARAVVPGD